MNQNTDNDKFPLRLLTGFYSGQLWESITAICDEEASTIAIYNAISSLHIAHEDEVATKLTHALYDILGFTIPAMLVNISLEKENRERYISEFLLDIENMI